MTIGQGFPGEEEGTQFNRGTQLHNPYVLAVTVLGTLPDIYLIRLLLKKKLCSRTIFDCVLFYPQTRFRDVCSWLKK